MVIPVSAARTGDTSGLARSIRVRRQCLLQYGDSVIVLHDNW